MSITKRKLQFQDSRDGSRSLRGSDASDRRSIDGSERVRNRRGSAEDGERNNKRHNSNELDHEFIKVAVRVRPRLKKELGATDGINVDGNSLLLTDGRDRKHFTFDEVIDSREDHGSQAVVFDRIGRGLLTQSMRGFNVCVFAFGHTGSGKTYTVLGAGGHANDAADGAGLLPRFVRELFMAHERDPRRKTNHYSCEFYEVYNETIKDLLAPANSDRTRTVHVHPKHGVRVEGLSCAVMSKLDEVLGLVSFGNQMRTVAATTMNERSSRSHAVFTCRFEQSQQEAQGQRTLRNCECSVTFVDLAGREDQEVTGNRNRQFREMCYINTSLFHLTHLIGKLSDGQVTKGTLSDFRNSKLTLLLHQALAGNSRTALIATVAPIMTHFDMSVSTLQFAANVKKVQTKPVLNNKTSQAVVSELESEVKALRKQLVDAKTSGTEKEQDLLAAQALIEHYKQSLDEALSNSAEEQQMRRRTASKIGLADMSNGGFAHPKSSTGQLLPFFTKLSDDPSLQGCCNYYLDKPRILIGRDATECTIVVEGVGIEDYMCEVTSEEVTGNITIQVADGAGGPPPRVVVNGHCLQKNTRQTLTHADSLILGYAHAFRLCVPAEAIPGLNGTTVDTEGLARAALTSLSLSSAVQELREENGAQFNLIMPYIQQLSTHAPEGTVNELLNGLNMLCPLIDEANLITKEVFGKLNTLLFRLHVLRSLFDISNDKPDLVVCVLQDLTALAKLQSSREFGPDCSAAGSVAGDDVALSPRSLTRKNTRHLIPGKEKHPEVHALGLSSHMLIGQDEQCSLLYVWSLEKFLQRLREMRDIYQEGCEGSAGFEEIRLRMELQPYIDPWREMTFAHVKLFAQDSTVASNILGGDHSSQLSKSQHYAVGVPGKVARMIAVRPTGASCSVPSTAGSITSMLGNLSGNAVTGLSASVVSSSGAANSVTGTMVSATGTGTSTNIGAADSTDASTAASISGVPGGSWSIAPSSASRDPGFAARAEGVQPQPSPTPSYASGPNEVPSTSLRITPCVPTQSSTADGLPLSSRPLVTDKSKEGKDRPLTPRCASFGFDAGNATFALTSAEHRAARPKIACHAESPVGAHSPVRACSPVGAHSSSAVQTSRLVAPMPVNTPQKLKSQDVAMVAASCSFPSPAAVNPRPIQQFAVKDLNEITQWDLELLQAELRSCRAETGRLFSEHGRLTGLLDRVGAVLGHITSFSPASMSTPLLDHIPPAPGVHRQFAGRTPLSGFAGAQEVRSVSPLATFRHHHSIFPGQLAVQYVPAQVELTSSMASHMPGSMVRMASPPGKLSAPSFAAAKAFSRRPVASRPVTPGQRNQSLDMGVRGCASMEFSPTQGVSGSRSPPLIKPSSVITVHGPEQSLSNVAAANLVPKLFRPTPPSTPRTGLRSTSPRPVEIPGQ